MNPTAFLIGLCIGSLIGPIIAVKILEGQVGRRRRSIRNVGKRSLHRIHMCGCRPQCLFEKGKKLFVGLFLRAQLLIKQQPLKSVCQPASEEGAEDYAAESGKESFEPHGIAAARVSEAVAAVKPPSAELEGACQMMRASGAGAYDEVTRLLEDAVK